MTLYELGKEYEVRCDELFKRIEELRMQVRYADTNAAIDLRRRICSLYADLEKCREISSKLMKYYENM